MIKHADIPADKVRSKIRSREICFGGNNKLKIYGKLNCKSGKRMKTENRVFFNNELAARAENFRPCGHCMKKAYQQWKYGTV